MPETPVNKDDLMAGWKDEIGTSRKISYVKAITIAQSMYKPSYNHFRAGVLPPHFGHQCASLFSGNPVHYYPLILSYFA